MLQKAEAQLPLATSATDQVMAHTQIIQAYEEGLAALREGLRQVSVRQRSIAQDFQRKEDRLSQLLGVLQTIGRSSAPLHILHPSGPLGTARSGMIISDVSPALHREAQALRQQLQELATLRALQEQAHTQVEQAFTQMQSARDGLANAVARRADVTAPNLSDLDQVQLLTETAETLQSFASGIADLGIRNAADFEGAKGKLRLPVAGILLHGFGEADASGTTRPGQSYAVNAGAILTAPWPATVRYAGPFLDLGTVVILEPGAEYLMVIAGMGHAVVDQGQIVEEGTALGFMGGNRPNADSFLIDLEEGTSSALQESLYIEIRRGGTPLNPADWFATKRE